MSCRHVSAYQRQLPAALRRDCPSGQVSSTNATQYPTSVSYFVRNADGSGGFVSMKACVNPPGYGFNGRNAPFAKSERCPPGSYNAGDTYSNCTNCPNGLTTAGPGVSVTAGDCGIAAGFAVVNGTVRPCPIGAHRGTLRQVLLSLHDYMVANPGRALRSTSLLTW